MKKLFFATKKLHAPMGQGGGETIAFDLLSELAVKNSLNIKALGAFNYLNVQQLNHVLKSENVDMQLEQQGAEAETLSNKFTYPSFAHILYQMPNSYATTLAREDHYGISFSEYLSQFQPDIALFQAEGMLEGHLTTLERKIKTICYIQNPFELQNFKNHNITPPQLITNSRFMQYKLKSSFGFDSEVLYPAINSTRYSDNSEKKESERLRVLFINPHKAKGLNIFLKLIDECPEVDFQVLEGWEPIEGQLQQLFASKSNVKILAKTWNMAEVYSNADLLIVPSQWDEAFGRVVVEAHAAGVPTLASHVGGLPEASGKAGFLVTNFSQAEAWIENIKKFASDRQSLSEKNEHFKDNTDRFSPEIAAEKFLELI